MRFKKEELINSTGAIILRDIENNSVDYGISTDTRTIQNGDIYLPLKGANFDGELFIEQALNAGAVGYITSEEKVYDKAQIVIKTQNTLDYYLKLAKYYKTKIAPITVGITGSSGKTTTKEIVYSVLKEKFNTHKTYSNHNNEIGFCQTVLTMPADTQALIVEMGMRGLGEIELISTHLNPDFAIITNSGTAHVGRLGSLDNIAIAKCEITKGLKTNGTLIANNQEIIKRHNNFSGETCYYTLNDVKILEKAPSYSKFEYKTEIYDVLNEIEYSVEFLDMNELDSFGVEDFVDSDHLNYRGAVKASRILNSYLNLQKCEE